MSAHRKPSPRLLPQVLLRVLPVAVLVLFATWYGTHRMVYSTVQTELVEKLNREAEFGAETIAARLDTLLASMRAVAGNDLVVNSLVDRVSRDAYIPTFMQSLRLPGPSGAKITFTDYRGRLIASNFDDIGRSDYFISGSSVDGFYMRVDDTGATFAVPVLYSGRQEGAIVVRYNQLHFQELLSVNAGTEVSAVMNGERVLQSSNWTITLPTEGNEGSGTQDYVIHGADVPGYTALRFVVAQPMATAFATVHKIQSMMLIAITVAVLALVLGIVLTAYLATRPLFAFSEEIKAIGEEGDLGHRVGSSGSAEFDRLSDAFNGMLERMQTVLVSHDRLDHENRARKKAERELRRSERRYRDVIEGSTRGIFICADDAILFANQGLAAMLGYDSPEALTADARVSGLFGVEMWDMLQAETGNDTSMTVHHEIQMPSEDGSGTWYEITARPTAWQGHDAVQCSLTDITERKEVEQLKNEFVSIVSHELRTPLTSVTGSLGLIQSGALGELPSKVEPLIKIAHSNTQRLVALVNDILDVEKIEAGHMEFHLDRVEATELCAQALAENVFYGAKFGVTFEFQPEIGETHVSADKDRLLQLLANLLSNAAKFSPEGGRVVLKLTDHEGAVRFSVIDEGAGIPASKQDTIFEKFKQADSSDSRAKAGTGLGLAICQSIAENHDSKIHVSSQEGKGSTFYFDLEQVGASGGETASEDMSKKSAVAV